MTDEIVVFPDAEAVVVGYLNRALTTRGRPVPVSTTFPSTAASPQQLVLVTLLSGPPVSLTITSVVAVIDVYGFDSESGSALARLIHGLIPGIAYETGSPVLGTSYASLPVNFPDPLTGAPAYTQQHTIRISGAAA